MQVAKPRAGAFSCTHLLLVGLFAVPGVGVRLLIGWCVTQAYGASEPSSRAALTSAGYFLPNVAGCFVLGFVARSKAYATALRLLRARVAFVGAAKNAASATAAAAPAAGESGSSVVLSPWWRSTCAGAPERVLGAIGTGFCGSLTTFASWMKGASEAAVDGHFAWALGAVVWMLAASWAAVRVLFIFHLIVGLNSSHACAHR